MPLARLRAKIDRELIAAQYFATPKKEYTYLQLLRDPPELGEGDFD